MPDQACRLGTILAALILAAAGAANWCERPVEDPHNMADLDFARRLGETIAALPTLAALDEAGVAQIAEDRIEERDPPGLLVRATGWATRVS